MATIKNWISAFRLRTLPLAMASIGMGGILAAVDNHFHLLIFVFCCLTTLFLQVLSNLANDYGDAIHGADSDTRQGPQRAVQSGAISNIAMKNALYIMSMLAFSFGMTLLYLSFDFTSTQFWVFLGIGLAAIAAAVNYTVGKNPYGYAGFGDIFVLIFFGWVGVGGTYFLQASTFQWHVFLPASTVGFAVGVLNINNIRDIDSDKAAGKKSIPVRLGAKKSRVYHLLLLFTAWLLSIVYVCIYYTGPLNFLFMLTMPLFVFNGNQVLKRKTAEDLDPLLKQMALSTLLFVLFFGIGLLV